MHVIYQGSDETKKLMCSFPHSLRNDFPLLSVFLAPYLYHSYKSSQLLYISPLLTEVNNKIYCKT